MQAWRVHELGHFSEVLRFEETDDPTAPTAGAVIEVRAAGLNFPDLLVISGQYQVKPPLPFTPGLECVGVVAEVDDESGFEPGDRVIGYSQSGAFAERIALKDTSLFACPEYIPDVSAAGLFITYQTGYFALNHRAQLQAGETVLVHGGAGGVGTAAIQLAVSMGARVIATAGGADKCEVCRRLGAHEVIDHKQTDFVAAVLEMTGGRGADVIFDPVGGDVFHRSTKCIAFGGRLLVIGFASGEIPEIRANRILLKNISIVGLHWGSYQLQEPDAIRHAHAALCQLFESGQIKPMVSMELTMGELKSGLAAIEDRASIGKVVVVNRPT